MSAADVARSERILNRIGAQVGLTECGRDWLISAVDPYHDTPLNVVGYPDVNEASSVVQVVKLSTGLNIPGGVDGNWDCHIHQFPWEGDSGVTTLVSGNDSDTSFQITAGSGHSGSGWGGISVDIVSSPNPTFHYTNTSISNPFVAQLGAYLKGEYRIIAKGFEVINTTSELNIQGLVTSYRYPMSDIDSAKTIPVYSGVGSASSTSALGWMSVLRTVAPPDSPTGALLLEGSKQWKAKEGAYVVSTLNSEELPTGVNNTAMVIELNTADSQSGSTSAITLPANVGTVTIPPTTPTNTLTILASPQTNLGKFNHAGAYFSGLSNSTTLQLNAIYVIERFPNQLDTDLVVLAKPSCRADDAAIQLYSEVIRMMPTGVPQRMNGLGEWFSDAVSAASDFISPVLSAIPHPMAQAGAAALKTGNNVVKALVGKSQPAPGQSYTPSGTVAVAKVAVKAAKAEVKKEMGKKKKKK